MKPHKHAELIKAWADGAEIEYRNGDSGWLIVVSPSWQDENEYRIKPEHKPDVVQFYLIEVGSNKYAITATRHRADNLCLTFDGETGKLKAAEVLK